MLFDFLLKTFNILSFLSVQIILTITHQGEVLLWSYLFIFLYLDGHRFLSFWGVSSYYFVEYISYAFGLYLFSSSDAHDLQDCFLDGITDIWHISFVLNILLHF
jgi:hypothetical protein